MSNSYAELVPILLPVLVMVVFSGVITGTILVVLWATRDPRKPKRITAGNCIDFAFYFIDIIIIRMIKTITGIEAETTTISKRKARALTRNK